MRLAIITSSYSRAKSHAVTELMHAGRLQLDVLRVDLADGSSIHYFDEDNIGRMRGMSFDAVIVQEDVSYVTGRVARTRVRPTA